MEVEEDVCDCSHNINLPYSDTTIKEIYSLKHLLKWRMSSNKSKLIITK